MPRQAPTGPARVARRGGPPPDEEPTDTGAGTATARAGRGAEVVFASADARQGTPQKAKLAAMQGRTIYRRRDGSVREKNVLDSLADILLAPFPADVRIKVRRAARDFQRGMDDLLQSLGGGGGPPRLPGPRR